MMRPPPPGASEVVPKRAHTGAQDLLRLDRLAQEVGDADLHEPARERVVEIVRKDDRPACASPMRDVTLCNASRLSRRFELRSTTIDRGVVEFRTARGLLDVLRDHHGRERANRSERGRDRVQERGVGADENDGCWCGRGVLGHEMLSTKSCGRAVRVSGRRRKLRPGSRSGCSARRERCALPGRRYCARQRLPISEPRSSSARAAASP